MEKQATSNSIEWSTTIPYGQSLMGSITFHQSGKIITLDPELATFLQLQKGDQGTEQSQYVHSFCADQAQLYELVDQVDLKKVTKGELLLLKKDGSKCIATVKLSQLSFGDHEPLIQLQCAIPIANKPVKKPSINDFDILLEGLPDSVFIHNYQVITHVNQAFLDSYGYSSKEEIIGRAVPYALVHPDDFALISETRKKAVNGQPVHIPNLRTLRKDGTVFLSESRLSTIYFEDVPHLLVVSRDVTKRLHHDEQLTEANLLMRESQRLAHLGSWQWEISTNTVTWSKELYLIYGLDESTFEASFEGYLQCVHPGDRTRVQKTIEEALMGKTSVHFEERIIRPDGEIRYLRSWGQVKTDREGRPVKMLGACLDVTNQKRSAEEYNEKKYQLRQLTESVQSAIIVVGENGSIQYWNNYASHIFGYSKEEALEMALPDLFSETDDESHGEIVQRLAHKKVANWKNKRLELKGVRKSGSTFPVEFALTSWRQGKSSFACAIVTDITERKKDREELAASAERYKTLFDTSLDGIYKSTPEGRFVEVNPALVQMLGYDSREELLNIDIKAELYFSQDEREGLKEEVPDNGVYVYRLRKKDGSEIWAEDHSRYEYDKRGKIIYHHGLIRDITKRKTAEDNLLHTLDITMEQNTRLMDFSYIVSHNLRSHSSNISGILSILEHTEEESEKARLMKMLKKVTSALDDTMYHLNNVVSIQTNKDLPSERLNLSEYINKTKAVLSEQIHSKKALVRNRVSKDIFVNYNVAYLESILLNFLSNAIKYCADDRRPVVTLSCKEEGGDVQLSIKDNGVGIDLDKHGKSLFGMYKTFHNNKNARGIGLFISKNQIEAMGGTVSVESELGKGAKFTILFKANPDELLKPVH